MRDESTCWHLQEVLAMASLAKRSMTLPGMKSDWEIDPDELEIAKRPDGTEWRLGTGASAHVSPFYVCLSSVLWDWLS